MRASRAAKSVASPWAVLALWIVPVLMFALFCVCAGIGAHRVMHMKRTADFLTHDPGCKTSIELTTPASHSPGCRIVHGKIVRSYEDE